MKPLTIPFDVNDGQLLNQFFNESIFEAIDKLEKETSPRWGKMDAREMVEHLINSSQISNGKIDVPCFTPEEKLDNLQKFLSMNKPMPREFNSPLDDQKPKGYQTSSFEEARQILKDEIRKFEDYFRKHPDKKITNPTFGKIGYDLWRKFHFKHCYHHLSQFGVIQEP